MSLFSDAAGSLLDTIIVGVLRQNKYKKWLENVRIQSYRFFGSYTAILRLSERADNLKINQMKKVECVKLTKYIVRATYRPGGLIGGYPPILRLLERADNLVESMVFDQYILARQFYFEIIGIGR